MSQSKRKSNLLLLRNISENPLALNREPSFMAVLLGKTDYCRQTSDGIYVIPITSLGA